MSVKTERKAVKCLNISQNIQNIGKSSWPAYWILHSSSLCVTLAIFSSFCRHNAHPYLLTRRRPSSISFIVFLIYYYLWAMLCILGSISTVWIAIRAFSSKRRKWSDTLNGTRSATSRSSTDSWDIRQVMIATTDTADALTIANRLITTASRYSSASFFFRFFFFLFLFFFLRGVRRLRPFCWFTADLFAYRRAAIRCTLARQTCRCTPITTARTRPSSRKVSNVSAPPRTAPLPIAPLMASAQLISTAGGRLATTPSRTKPIWVTSLLIYSLNEFGWINPFALPCPKPFV